MSYILDALKKAESERTLGAAPNLFAQPAAGLSAPRQRKLWQPALLTLTLITLATIGLLWLQPWKFAAKNTPPTPKTLATSSVIANPPAAAAPTQIVQENPPPLAEPPSVAAIAPQHEKSPDTVTISTPAVTETTLAVHRSAHQDAPKTAKIANTLQDLPENIQRELPAVTIKGYIYAQNPADRSVLIDARLLREGDQVAPSLILEKITHDGMVLNYQGYRYRVGY